MLLSIIVPVYKTELYLAQCIQSILVQTFSDFQLILVDDGSPDQCPFLCDEWAAKDSRIGVIHQKNGGPQSAIIAGLQSAKGRYIGFVDSDDWIDADYFEVLINNLQNNQADIVSVGWTSFNDSQILRQVSYPVSKIYDKARIEKDILLPFWEVDANLYINWSNGRWNKLWKRELLLAVMDKLDPDLFIGEDAILNLLYLPLCSCAVTVNDYSGYHLRGNPDSLTHSFSIKSIDRNLHYFENLDKTALQQNRSFQSKPKLETAIFCDLLWQSQESPSSLRNHLQFARRLYQEFEARNFRTKMHSQMLSKIPMPFKIGFYLILNGLVVPGTLYVQICFFIMHCFKRKEKNVENS